MKHNIYKEIVEILAKQSTCDRAHVGALLLKNGRIVATGYNGSLPKAPHCNDVGHFLVDDHCIRTVHAEQNVLCFCAKEGISTNGCELYVTHLPCPICTKLLVQAGITKVYYVNDYKVGENPFINFLDTEKITNNKNIGAEFI